MQWDCDLNCPVYFPGKGHLFLFTLKVNKKTQCPLCQGNRNLSEWPACERKGSGKKLWSVRLKLSGRSRMSTFCPDLFLHNSDHAGRKFFFAFTCIVWQELYRLAKSADKKFFYSNVDCFSRHMTEKYRGVVNLHRCFSLFHLHVSQETSHISCVWSVKI